MDINFTFMDRFSNHMKWLLSPFVPLFICLTGRLIMSNTESENLSKVRQLILNQNNLTTEEKETLLNELENMYELKKCQIMS